MEVTVKGLSELVKAFNKANVELPRNLHMAMVDTTNAVRQTAKAIVPIRTGTLKHSITQMVSDNPLIGKITAGGNAAPYAPYVEYGTYKMRARPYMKPALEYNAPGIARRFQRAVEEVLTMMK